ncbi:hypothetical protein HMPREF9530_05435 [Escherichia coli MS 21-1]|nr:hypothetical protein HMPREF9530_05435 [Escherichia coli MS 21-1]
MKYGKGLVAPSHKCYSDLAVFFFLAHSLTTVRSLGLWSAFVSFSPILTTRFLMRIIV